VELIKTPFALTLLAGRQEEHSVCENKWSVVADVHMICIWSSWCHCHFVISCRFKIQSRFAFQLPAYQDRPGKDAVTKLFLPECLQLETFWMIDLCIILSFVTMHNIVSCWQFYDAETSSQPLLVKRVPAISQGSVETRLWLSLSTGLLRQGKLTYATSLFVYFMFRWIES